MALRKAGLRVINTDAVVSIKEIGGHPNQRLHFIMNNGNEFDVIGEELEDWIIKDPKPFISAQPGFRRISAHRSSFEQDWNFMELDVIGWGINHDGNYVSPITIDGDEGVHFSSKTSFAAIIDPMGRCSVPNYVYFDTVEEWKGWINDRNIEHLQKRAEQNGEP